MLRHVVEHVRDGSSGSDGIDGDLLPPGIFGQDLDEGGDGRFRRRVDRMAWYAIIEGGVGRHQNDSASLIQVTVRLAGNKELGAGVEAEYAIEFLFRYCSHYQS